MKQIFMAILLLISGVMIGYLLANGDDSNTLVPASGSNEPSIALEQDSEGNNEEGIIADVKLNLAQKAAQVPINVKQAIEAVVAKPTQFEQFAAAYPLAIQANQQQLGQMIDTLMAMESQIESIGVARIFYLRYVDINPIEATAHFWRTVPKESSQYRRIKFHVYHEWAWFDMENALQDIITNAPQDSREGLISFLLGDEHFGTNEQLLELAQNFSERTRAAALLASAERESHETAFERILALPKNSDARRHGLYRLVRRWAKADPAAALEQIKQMSNGGDRQNLLSTVISVWAESDAEQALVAALGLGQGNNYGYSALSTLAKKDGARALELARQYSDRLDSNIGNQVLQTWASSDARAAANYLETKGDSVLKGEARQIAWHYTMQYPEEAYLWAERVGLLSDPNVASNMGSALVQTDLAKAESLFAELPPSASRNGLFTNIVRQRSKMDIGQTYKWLMQYKDEPKFKDAQNNLLYEWTRRDPLQAIEVAMEMDDQVSRANYLSSAANSWYEKSPEQAISWVMELSQGTERDRILGSLAQRISSVDADEALYVANQISNAQMRDRIVEFVKKRNSE